MSRFAQRDCVVCTAKHKNLHAPTYGEAEHYCHKANIMFKLQDDY